MLFARKSSRSNDTQSCQSSHFTTKTQRKPSKIIPILSLPYYDPATYDLLNLICVLHRHIKASSDFISHD